MSPHCQYCGAFLVAYKDQTDNLLFCPVCGAVKPRNKYHEEEEDLENK